MGRGCSQSQFYTRSILSVCDVTSLAHEVHAAHSLMRKRKPTEREKGRSQMEQITRLRLPVERPYHLRSISMAAEILD